MATLSGTTYPLSSSGSDEAANGHSFVHDNPSTSVQSVRTTYEASVIDGRVVVDGHVLAINSTLTLGSGNVLTRLAITTNNVGVTLLLGDMITTAIQTSLPPANHSSRLQLQSSLPQKASTGRMLNTPSPSSFAPKKANSGASSIRSARSKVLTSLFGLVALIARVLQFNM